MDYFHVLSEMVTLIFQLFDKYELLMHCLSKKKAYLN